MIEVLQTFGKAVLAVYLLGVALMVISGIKLVIDLLMWRIMDAEGVEIEDNV